MMKSNSETNKKYDQEYKNDVARMVVDGGRTVRAVSGDTGVSITTVRAWTALYRKSQVLGSPGAVTLSPVDLQLKAVLEENRKLKMQVTFLKKTMAYFVEQPQ
jgi:transposase